MKGEVTVDRVSLRLLEICKTFVPNIERCNLLVERLHDFVEEETEQANDKGYEAGRYDQRCEQFHEDE
jgi:hypothetical protein